MLLKPLGAFCATAGAPSNSIATYAIGCLALRVHVGGVLTALVKRSLPRMGRTVAQKNFAAQHRVFGGAPCHPLSPHSKGRWQHVPAHERDDV